MEIVLWLIFFDVTSIYILDLSPIMNLHLLRLWLLLAIFGASLVTYAMLMKGESTSYIASGAGGTIGTSIPYWTFIILVVGILAYGVLAVYQGNSLNFHEGSRFISQSLTIEIGDITIGMGGLFL